MDTLFASLHTAMYKKFGDNVLLLMWQKNLSYVHVERWKLSPWTWHDLNHIDDDLVS
jgi:hypothetical protein